MKKQLDRIDHAILRELQSEGRLSNSELSRRVNLSPTPCLERVKRLERDGYIRRYTAVLNAKKLGVGLVVFIEIGLNRTSRDVFADFKESVIKVPEVQECHLVSGNFDYLIKARVANMDQYRALLGEKILVLPGVRESRSYVVMETVKEGQELKLDGWREDL
ncbi:Transcriptional regulator [Hahella chejuensis KCTC 2396]|uniref:Leucine-responsive regulatory protein n=1 Tax=Hahella chejuensis (strain KCTC 2396) TaxID=349521 RepID=Q2SNB4_HAHCH|nr:Lrp/AsnC ligand binding domain-containing protein [Hahella chejuensis]ABC27860.1 Transcriptional regulator [Hahella chejuensis KCTC 2396]